MGEMLRPRPSTRRHDRHPTARSAFRLFAAGTAGALALGIGGGYLALRSVALDEAKRETRTRVLESGKLVESVLLDGIEHGDPEALAAVDATVLTGVLNPSVLRVKLWSARGDVLYSDNGTEIGGRFALDEDQRQLLERGGTEVEVSGLDRPENALDPQQGKVIEAYTRIRTPSGTPLLFEIYERHDSVQAGARRLLGALAPPILGALGLIVLVQIPLVWSLSRRLQRGHEEREALLAGAIQASNRERRRIASYLHDGPVQDIAGVAFALAPLADAAGARGDDAGRTALRGAAAQLRQNVRDLRSLLVDLHPPHLAAQGLKATLRDLASPLEARGVAVALEVAGDDRLDAVQQALVHRVAQEALRNVLAYAAATSVEVRVVDDGDTVRLVVADDGRGFDEETRVLRANEGHMGLSLLEELARQSGARLEVRSGPGSGTTVELEVPVG